MILKRFRRLGHLAEIEARLKMLRAQRDSVIAWVSLQRALPPAGANAMNYDEYNAFCCSLPATSHVVQWGGAHVWKVGGKVFAIGGWQRAGEPHITFKVSEVAYQMLKDQPGLRPAPYLASRGMSWIQHCGTPGLSDQDLKAYLRESHRIVASGLSKKQQRALGLLAP